MITYVQGDALETNDPIIVHGCNAQGVMGKGIAKSIREKWPIVYQLYRQEYEESGLKLGQVIYVGTSSGFGPPIVANAITQDHYANKSGDPGVFVDYQAIRDAMKSVAAYCRHNAFMEISMPKIGAGLGGGDWAVIEKIIEAELEDFAVTVYVL